MLPKEHRLRRERDFDRVFKNGATITRPPLRAKIARREDAGPARIGVIVGRRVSRRAVVRHRIKRIIRAAVHGELAEIPAGCDVAIVALPGAENLDSNDLHSRVRSLLKELTMEK